MASKEVIKFSEDWKVKIEAVKDIKDNRPIEEVEEQLENQALSTFNLGTTKEKEKEAKDSLVLPFYKEPQKIGEVKLQKGDTSDKGEVEAGKIYYEPDSGDDWDDEDPDDDLDF